MGRRPLCILCVFLAAFLYLADLAGFSLIRGNPLPESVQMWIKEHPQSVVCGEVVKWESTETSQTVTLKNTYLIYHSEKNSEKISIDNLKVYLKSNNKQSENLNFKAFQSSEQDTKEKKDIKKTEKLPAGSVVVVSGNLEEIESPRNPGEFNSRQYYLCRHMYYFMKKATVQKVSSGYSSCGQFLLDMQEHFSQILQETCKDQAPVFEAIVLGNKTDLEQEVKLRYQMGGIIHILAISGLHISLIGMGLYQLLKKMGLGIWPAGFLALVFMLLYGMMTGGTVSTMRAVCMFLVSVGAKITGRIYDLMTALAVAGILILLQSPSYLLDGGFLLSFGAVIGAGGVYPVIREALGIKSKGGTALLSSVVLQLTTLPVVLWFYGEVSLAGILLNLIVLPSVGIVLACGTGCAVTGLFSIRIAGVVAFPGRFLLMFYEKLCEESGKLPFAVWTPGQPSVWMIVGYYLLLAGVLWICLRQQEKQKKWKWKILCFFMAFCGVCMLNFQPKDDLKITCLDVGQGDGIVVQIKGKWNFLIDGGSTNKSAVGQYQILPYLKNQGISRLDGIYISHTDEDHISGVRQILEYMGKNLISLKADYLILPDWKEKPDIYLELEMLAKEAGVKILYVKEGDEIHYGKVKLEILWPQEGISGTDINEEAMVIRLKSGNFQGLFTGDIGEETEQKLNLQPEKINFLKVAHHGSRYSSGEDFLEKIRPDVAVISCSATNRYGHPSPDTLEKLQDIHASTYITKDSGAVSVCLRKQKMLLSEFIPDSK